MALRETLSRRQTVGHAASRLGTTPTFVDARRQTTALGDLGGQKVSSEGETAASPSPDACGTDETRVSGLHEPVISQPDVFFDAYPVTRRADYLLFCKCLPWKITFKKIVILWIGGYTVAMVLIETGLNYAYSSDEQCTETDALRRMTIIAVCVAVALLIGHISLIVFFIMRITRPLRKLDEGMRMLISGKPMPIEWENHSIFEPFPLIKVAASVHRQAVDDLERHKVELSRTRDALAIATAQRRELAVRLGTVEKLLIETAGETPCIVTVFCGTWNVGNQPLPDSLSTWIHTDADIVAIGVQECAIISHIAKMTMPLESNFARLVQDALGKQYYMVECANILGGSNKLKDFASDSAGIRIFVFARRSLRMAISNVRSGHVRTGIAKVAYNKGAVSISFTLHARSFCFINSHLAAHQEKVRERAEDFHRIVSRLEVGATDMYCTTEFDAVFWMGDLNYRIDLPRDLVLGKIADSLQVAAPNWDVLQRHDQLNTERAAGNAFGGFSEGSTNFAPTFKHDFGAPTYENVKKRVPAWCDRILWKIAPGLEIEQQVYDSAKRLMVSDHRPVYARFAVHFVSPRPAYIIGGFHFGLHVVMATLTPIVSLPGGVGALEVLEVHTASSKLRELLKMIEREGTREDDKRDALVPKRLVARFSCPDIMDPNAIDLVMSSSPNVAMVDANNSNGVHNTASADGIAWGASDVHWDMWESRAEQVASRAVRISVGIVKAPEKAENKRDKADRGDAPPSPGLLRRKDNNAEAASPDWTSAAQQSVHGRERDKEGITATGSAMHIADNLGFKDAERHRGSELVFGTIGPLITVTKANDDAAGAPEGSNNGAGGMPCAQPDGPILREARGDGEAPSQIVRRKKIGEGVFGLASLTAAVNEHVAMSVPLYRGGRAVGMLRLVAKCVLVQNSQEEQEVTVEGITSSNLIVDQPRETIL